MTNSGSQAPSPNTPVAGGRAVSNLLLSVAVAPMLVGIVAEKLLTSTLRELGVLSEELFRGDRLPLVNSPQTADKPDSAPADPNL